MKDDYWGGDLGFVGGDVPEAGVSTRGIPKADNGTEGCVIEGWDLEGCGSIEGPLKKSRNPSPRIIYQQAAGNSGGVVDIASNIGGLLQGDSLRGSREAPEAVVAANGGQETAECYVKIYFGGGKGESLEIRQAWRGRRRQLCSGVGGRCREKWVSVSWDRDR